MIKSISFLLFASYIFTWFIFQKCIVMVMPQTVHFFLCWKCNLYALPRTGGLILTSWVLWRAWSNTRQDNSSGSDSAKWERHKEREAAERPVSEPAQAQTLKEPWPLPWAVDLSSPRTWGSASHYMKAQKWPSSPSLDFPDRARVLENRKRGFPMCLGLTTRDRIRELIPGGN